MAKMTPNAEKAAEELRRINAQRKLIPFDTLQVIASACELGRLLVDKTTIPVFSSSGFRVTFKKGAK
jgi:hypothetical protein